MPGTSGPSVSVFVIGKLSAISRSFSATKSTRQATLHLSILFAVIATFVATGFPQGTGDIPDVHIAPRVKAEPTSAVASPDVSTPSVGLKSTERRIKVDVNLVLVPVTVTDPMNRLVTGLSESLTDHSWSPRTSGFGGDSSISLHRADARMGSFVGSEPLPNSFVDGFWES